MTRPAQVTAIIWTDTADTPCFNPLRDHASADVCVVGGGIAGMTTAYLLAREGARVVLLEADRIGSGETARTTAHLSNALDHLYSETENAVGADGIRVAAHSHSTAIDLIESIVAREHIACEFERVDGYLFAASDGSFDVLQRELDAGHRAGLTNLARVDRAPLPLLDTGPCLRFARQAQFHPLKYLAGLARAFANAGGRIYDRSRAVRVQGGSPVTVTTMQGCRVSADAAVVATNSPIHDYPLVHLKQSPYRTYVVGAFVARGRVPRALYWDTADPFHYVRLCSGPAGSPMELLLVGGEDHRAGEDGDGSDRFDALESWARRRFPIGDVAYRWSGQIMESADGVGLIGRDTLDEPNVYYATGDCGQGMTHGTIAGALVTDILCRRQNTWASLYDPGRFPSTWDVLQENLDVLWHYGEWLTGGDVGSADAIARSDGAVIRRGLVKIAASRDDHGVLSECSAVCPHLGCIVAWNSIDKTWNCPCHGSRFDRLGRVMNGPSASGLSPLDPR